ncbi:MAG: hypothetical protein WC971_07310 [Coriobacteriia bacterium]
MDYVDIVKRAIGVTWRYKVLWIFGVFVGASGMGGGGGNSGYRFGKEDFSGSSAAALRAQAFVRDNVALLVGVAVAFLVLSLVLWILGVAARGGLVHLVEEAEEGRPVRALAGWDAGFSKWGRVFLIEFVVALPIIILALVVGAVVAVAIAGAAAAGFSSSGDIARAAAGALLAGGCGVLALSVVAFTALAFLIGLVEPLALRYGVLGGLTVGHALGAAWRDVRHRFKDVVLMWLTMLVTGMAFGLAVGVVAAILAVPVVVAVIASAWMVVAVLCAILIAVMLLLSAVYGTYVSAAWTVFFRRLTGREALVSAVEQPAAAG